MERRIMHLDIDAFFASVEQLRNPRLQGRPVIVGSGCIASCSYEARRYGLYAGQSLTEAKRLCPHAVVLEGSYSAYRCFTERIWEMCRDFSPEVETGLDDAYLDLTRMESVYSNPLRSAQGLRDDIKRETGLIVTAGIGPTRIVARMAGKSAKPNGLRLIERSEAGDFLAGFRVGDLPGVGHKTGRMLASLNIRTVGELRLLPREGLARLFGKLGIALYDRCRGLDTLPVSKREIPHSISRETTFHRETTDRTEIEGMLYYLTERVGNTLRQLGCGARTVHLKIRYGDFEGESSSRSLPEPTDVDEDIYGVAAALLRKIRTRRVALRHVGICVSRISPTASGKQEALFGQRNSGNVRRLLRAIDTIRRRFGFSSIVAGKSLNLLGKLKQDSCGYVLRTPSLTK